MNKFINKVIQGNCLDLIKQIPNKSIDLIVTDPPYNTGMVEKIKRKTIEELMSKK